MHVDRKLQEECQKSANGEVENANATTPTLDDRRNILHKIPGTEGPGIGEVSFVSPQAIALRTKLHLPNEQCKSPVTPLHISSWKEAPRLSNRILAHTAEGLTTTGCTWPHQQNMVIVDDSISR